MLIGNHIIGIVLRLIFDQLSHTVADANHALDTVLRRDRSLDRRHAAVFTVVDHAVHKGIREVADARIGGNALVISLVHKVIELDLRDLGMDVLYCLVQSVRKRLIFIRFAGRLRSEGSAFQLHLADDHIRVVDEVLVHRDPVCVFVQMHPIGLDVDQPVPLLQEQNVSCHICSCRILESVVRQSDRAEQVSSLCDVLSDGGVFLIHCEARGYKCDHASRSNLIQSSGKEIVVDVEIVLVVLLVRHLELTERHVANRRVKEAVGKLCTFKALHGNVVLLIQLLRDPA